MAKAYKEKMSFNVSPCKAPDPCLDYEDYDPCESSEDITEKDLAVLLKEEQAKLRREKEKAEAELRRQEAEETGKSSDERENRGKAEGRGGADGRGADGRGADGRGADGRGAEGEKPCHRLKKRLCRKLISNPFFTNRLRFSNDLPPPPPVPPPQFYPRVDDSDSKLKVCPKRRKKCKKKDDKRGDDKRGDDDQGGQGQTQSQEPTAPLDEGECNCLYEDECLEEEAEVDDRKKGKRRCRKPTGDRPPCRKKVSEVSITLQPRHIPALQRDLPPTCPKDIPEVERQIMMACGKDCEIDCSKKKCKKKFEKTK